MLREFSRHGGCRANCDDDHIHSTQGVLFESQHPTHLSSVSILKSNMRQPTPKESDRKQTMRLTIHASCSLKLRSYLAPEGGGRLASGDVIRPWWGRKLVSMKVSIQLLKRTRVKIGVNKKANHTHCYLRASSGLELGSALYTAGAGDGCCCTGSGCGGGGAWLRWPGMPKKRKYVSTKAPKEMKNAMDPLMRRFSNFSA